MKRILVLLSVLVLACFAKIFEIDKDHSNIGFVVKHLSISNINGNFGEYVAYVDFDTKTGIPTKLEAIINPSSIFTRNQKRDKELASQTFFNIEKFKDIKFKMNELKNGKIYGTLEIKNIKKDIVLDYKYNGNAPDKKGIRKYSFTIATVINRKDFDVGTSYPNELINDDVKIAIDIQGFMLE